VLFIPGADMPEVSTQTTELRFNAQYIIDRVSAVRFLYWFQRLKSNDFAYDGMQVASAITSVIPTNEQAPNYSVNVFGVSYTRTFR
jgi:hypothetical protein